MVKGDCMAFGMGCCCLQVTFQSRNVSESRFMYDQLAGLAPIMMALGAATPIFKGRLVDTDVRWTIISQSVDDRTPAERGLSGGSSDQQQTPAPDAAMELRCTASRSTSPGSFRQTYVQCFEAQLMRLLF